MRDCSQIRRFDKLNLMIFQHNNRTPQCRAGRQRTKTNATPSHHRSSLAFRATLVLAFSAFGPAASVFDDSLIIEETQFNHGYCNVSSARLALDITETFGEPVIANRFEWEAGRIRRIVFQSSWTCGSNSERTKESGFLPVHVNAAKTGLISQEFLASPGWDG